MDRGRQEAIVFPFCHPCPVEGEAGVSGKQKITELQRPLRFCGENNNDRDNSHFL